MSDCLRPHGLQHAKLPCPSPSPGACSNSCPSSWWCHPSISSSVVPFSSCLQCFLASGSFPILHIRWPNIGASASASVLPMNIQGWFPLRLTSVISLLSKGFSRVFSSTLLLLSRFSRVWLCATPETAAHQASPFLGFSRQEHWSGLPFPSLAPYLYVVTYNYKWEIKH